MGLDRFGRDLQKRCGMIDQNGQRQITMTFAILRFVERIIDSRLDAHRRIGRYPHLARYLIGSLKTNPVDFSREQIRLLLEYGDDLFAIYPDEACR